jgi:hypothetical protein
MWFATQVADEGDVGRRQDRGSSPRKHPGVPDFPHRRVGHPRPAARREHTTRAVRLLALVIALGLVVGMAALFALSSLSPAVCAVVRVAQNKYDRGLPTPPPACG